jgi:hypothetical protein
VGQPVAQVEHVQREQPTGEPAPALEVGLHDLVAVQAEHLDVVEVAAEQIGELVGLEQRHVVRVLEVGGRVRGDEEGRPVAENPGHLGDVCGGVDEVFDEV